MRKDVVDTISAVWPQELAPVSGVQFELSKRAARLSAMFSERVNAELARLGLTKAEYEILAVLRASGAPYRLRPSDVGGRLLLSSGGHQQPAASPGRSGPDRARADPSDARSSWVRLLRHGVAVAEKAVIGDRSAQSALLHAVPPEVTHAAIDALRDLLIALGDSP